VFNRKPLCVLGMIADQKPPNARRRPRARPLY
jgi:hypothetical protein